MCQVVNKALPKIDKYLFFVVKEKFSIPEDLAVTVTDETGTEVDKDVFPDVVTTSGLIFVINELIDIGE